MKQRWMDVPDQVRADPTAQDLLRVWGLGESQVFSVRVERWDDPAAWGILLADLARHIARSYSEAQSQAEEDALERVIAGFHAELPK
jgi:hypothetical protein